MDDHLRTRFQIVEKAVSLFNTIFRERQGRIIFMAGESGSGRSMTLKSIQESLSRESIKPVILAGHFRRGQYEPWEKQKPAGVSTKDIFEMITKAVSFSSNAADPKTKSILLLANQLVQASVGAGNLIKKFLSEPKPRLDTPESMKELLRAVASEGPVVCLLDDIDQAEGIWWPDFIRSFSVEIAVDFPILFIVALHGPADIREQKENEADILRLSRQLIQRDLADWWFLRPLNRDEIATWIGNVDPSLVDQLYDITGGNPRWVTVLWRDWKEREKVQLTGLNGRWEITPGQVQQSLGTINDIFEARLKKLLGESIFHNIEETTRLLACAALEGTTFTADAVAKTLGWGRDELIDFLDDFLVKDSEHPEGLLTEEACVVIQSQDMQSRHLWRYSFSSDLFWHTINRYGLTPVERRELSLGLAHSLAALYRPKERQIARILATLFYAGGDFERAEQYREIADFLESTEAMHLQALNIITLPKGKWDYWEYTRAISFLLLTSYMMEHTYTYRDTIAILDAANEMILHLESDDICRVSGLRRLKALLFSAQGELQRSMGNTRVAYTLLEEGLKLCDEVRLEVTAGGILHTLGLADMSRGDSESARCRFEKAEEIARRHKIVNLTTILANFALLERDQGNYDAALSKAMEALELSRQIEDTYGEAYALKAIADIEIVRGDYESAEQKMKEALGLCRQNGYIGLEGVLFGTIGSLYFEREDYTSAIQNLTKGLDVFRRLGDRPGQASYLLFLCTIHNRIKEYSKALRHLKESYTIIHQSGFQIYYGPMYGRLGRISKESGFYDQGVRLLILGTYLVSQYSPKEGNARFNEQKEEFIAADHLPEEFDEIYKQVIEQYLKDGCIDLVRTAFNNLEHFYGPQ
jgi:tetratricopeptide (TPR) repeat protein